MTSRTARPLAALALAASLLVVAAPPVAAAGIVVNSLADTVANDGACTLREAIIAANTDLKSGAAVGECPKGLGSDVITFSVAGTITLPSALTPVTTTVTIDGGGLVTLSAAGHGILIGAAGSSLSLRGLTLTNGFSDGGGAVEADGNVTIADSIITGNHSNVSGGGINVGTSGTLVIRDSVVSANSALRGGGIGMAGASSQATIIRTAIVGNSASNGGGGIEAGGTLALANSTVASNTASVGGGIDGYSAPVTILNSTITGNTATGGGGGLLVQTGSTVTVKNTILTGNTSPSFDPNLLGTIDTDVANLITVDTVALLDPQGLQDNGGPTPTVGLNAGATNAIGQGNAGTCASILVIGLDQRGLARGATCDIGAVERDTTAPSVTVPTLTVRTGQVLDPIAGIPVHLAWTGVDAAGGSGVARWVVERSVNGDAYELLTASLTSPGYNTFVPSGTKVQFHVRTVDHDGNLSGWAAGPAVTPTVIQQTTGVAYVKTWTSQSATSFSGGSVRYATAAGASASYTFTGRSISLVTTLGSNRGKAKVYVDGKLVKTVDCRSVTLRYRVAVWSMTWTSSAKHTVKVVVLGTAGRPRVDLDAFVVLK